MSLLSTIGGAVSRIGGGFLTGGPAGAIGGAIGLFAGTSVTKATPSVPIGAGSTGLFGGIINGPQTMPFGLPTVGQVTGTNWGGAAAQTACPKGYHLNKHALAATHKHGAVAAHTMCVRNRHVNPLNHRALTRSLRRLKRAGKLVRKLHGVGGQRRIGAGSSGGHRPGCGCFRCRKR